ARARGLIVSGGFDGTVRLWRTEGPTVMRTWRHRSEDLTAIDISADGAFIAGAGADGSVRVWANSSRGSRDGRRLKAHDGRITALALGPQGVLATAGEDGSVKLWNPRTGSSARALGLHLGLVRALSFSRDGRRLFAAGEDGIIRVWLLEPPATLGAL